MPGKKQKAKERLDKYYEDAKAMGYRSRAAFKLTQLNKKYDFLSRAKTLVDLCAAPGSWSQIAAKAMPAGSTIVAVDLVQIQPIKGVKCLQGDITTDKTRSAILTALDKKKCEVVVHDGAPNVGGTWAKDAYNQNYLTLQATKLACEVLQPGGWFITKVFRSGDSARLVWVFKQVFDKVEQFKPAASRAQSAEVFYACAGYKAPKKLDAHLFSAKTVFQMLDDDQRVDKVDPTAHMAKGKRKAIGYDEGTMLLYKKVPVGEFLVTDDPKQFLQVYNEITWEGDEDLKGHKATNNDVVECFKDLRVISKWDQNNLIKWAKRINRERAELVRDEKDAARESALLANEGINDGEEADDERILKEIADKKKRDAKSKKRAERKMIEGKLLQAERLGYNPQDMVDDAKQDDYFSFSKLDLANAQADINEEDYDENADVGKLNTIADMDMHRRDEQGMDTIMHDDDSSEDDDDDQGKPFPMPGDDSDDDGTHASSGGESEGLDDLNAKSGKKRQPFTTIDYYRGLEKTFDDAYRNREDLASDEQATDEEDSDEEANPEKYINSSEGEDSSTEGGDDDDSDSIQQERTVKVRKTTVKGGVAEAKKAAEVKKSGDEEGSNVVTVQQAVRSERLDTGKKDKKKNKGDKKKKATGKKGPGGFEEIPTVMVNDLETRGRVLAIAQQMLDSKKRKREILEEGIHRYCHGPEEGLPKWFVDDEKRHNVRPLPVTKLEVEDQKSRFREVNARPAKKVAEAMGRRRKRAGDKLKRILAKEKSDPRLKGTAEGLTIRKLVRGKELRWKKKQVAQDAKSRGDERLAKKKAKFKGKKANKPSPGQRPPKGKGKKK
ncbi:AdoMet-dependent rRNA methyltransferase spb1 [Diplonema papillatum]|nr:AdoMet-dependent rRNA methyltransferase spb1 [Diplonema papillatum]